MDDKGHVDPVLAARFEAIARYARRRLSTEGAMRTFFALTRGYPDPPATHHGGNGSATPGLGGGGGGSAGGSGGPNSASGPGHVQFAAGGLVSGGGSWSDGSAGVSSSLNYINSRYGGGGGGGSWAVAPSASPADKFGEDEPEPSVVPASFTAYRWWYLPAPDFRGSPARAETEWPHAPLHGMRAPWEAVVSHAVCLNGSVPHDTERVPVKGCGCGFWAYWHPHPCPSMIHDAQKQLRIFGVIKGFGRARTGSRGSRCATARILAVHPSFTLLPFVDARFSDNSRDPLVTRVMDDGRQLAFPASVTPEQAQLAVTHSEAWMAVIGDRLEQDYPGVTVCETRDALIKRFPPDPVYGTRYPAPYSFGM